MRIGFVLMPTDPWDVTVARAQRLESLEYEHVWVYDHLAWRHYKERAWYSAIPWLTGVAALTTSIRVGTMVANPNLRHPLVLAKDAMTLDHVSRGRFTLGIGAGGVGFDATIFGQNPLTPRQRIERLEEHVRLLDGLLRGTTRTHSGKWCAVDDAPMFPGCVQRPRLPLAVAAGGPRALRLVAEVGDAWITTGDPHGHEASEAATVRIVGAHRSILEEHATGFGRDPATIDRIFLFGHTDARPLQSVEAFRDVVGRYGDMGFTDLVFHHPRADDPVWNEPESIVEEIAAARDAPWRGATH